MSSILENISAGSDRIKSPAIFLEGGILFPQNVIILPGLAGFRLEDVGSQNVEGLSLCVIPKGVEGEFDNELLENGEKYSYPNVGTIASVSGVTKLNSGQYGLIIKGSHAVNLSDLEDENGRYFVNASKIPHVKCDNSVESKAAIKMLKTLALEFFKNSPSGSQESFTLINSTEDPLILSNLVASHLTLSLEEKVKLLSRSEISKIIKDTTTALIKEGELSVLLLQIQDKVKNEVNANMKKAFLREQLEAMKKELGELDGSKGELYDLQDRLDDSGIPPSAHKEITKEIGRMEMMPPGSPEYMVSFNYVSWVLDLPWKRDAISPNTIDEAISILNNDHFGLVKVKERIIEYIASLMHVKTAKSQILLLVGPPGVGKTSLVKSVASALNRPYERISLGGVDDVSEIRGHRRTYIGAMPGRIIDALKKAKSPSPVILLDEIDKAGKSHRGDLGAALLEVLDPEQNKSFVDLYIATPFDLSDVVFIATANSLEGISKPLLDRMEVITLPGYDEEEKVSIAKKHIIPKLTREFDLRRSDLNLSLSVLKLIIRHYTRESGVRMLKQRLTKLARKAVCNIVENKPTKKITTDNLSQLLGKPLVGAETSIGQLTPGVALGLAYTSYGGDVLHVESTSYPPSTKSGSMKLTGSLGDVMKESASVVMSFIMSKSEFIGLDREKIEKLNIHVHFPEGAVPKDGPSAGVALLNSIVSLLSGKKLSKNLAMTGEITLRGDILPVGGIREKIMGAHKAGVDKVIIPAANWYDLDDVPRNIISKMQIFPLTKMEDALAVAGLLPNKKEIEPRFYLKREEIVKIPLKKWRSKNIEEYIN